MSEPELYCVAAYEFEDEAHLARGHLESEGIECFVLGGDSAGFGGLTADATFQVVVNVGDHERAKQVIESAAGDEDETPIPAWTCACGEQVDEGFAICWSCGGDWPGGTSESSPSDD